MFASLPMYARPELLGPHERFWQAVRRELWRDGIEAPTELDQSKEGLTAWSSEQCFFSQTCGRPYKLALHGKVHLVGTPDYGLNTCPPGYYRSAIIARRDDTRAALVDFQGARLALNDRASQSGYAALKSISDPLELSFEEHVTGAHLQSVKAVQTGSADIAAIDALTWHYASRFDYISSLRIIDWTPPTPTLPFITARPEWVAPLRQALGAAIDNLSEEDRDLLQLKGLVLLEADAYLALYEPQE